MCGRFVSSSSPDDIARYFGAEVETGVQDLRSNYNVAPTNDVMVVYEDGSTRLLDTFHWGLVPSWAKDLKIGSRMINARAETVAEKSAFKRSLAKRRCILPVDGFFEWAKVPGQKNKQPYFIHGVDEYPLAFAGLWAEWRGEVAGESVVVRSTTIITTAANQAMAPVHDRMPVILPPHEWSAWLDPAQQDPVAVQRLLVPSPETLLRLRPVSTQVNNVRNKGAELIVEVEPISPTDQTTLL